MSKLIDRFRRFFAATNGGASPYPWQEALLVAIAETGGWPAAITAPTGSGKSSVVDIHVFLVAERERTRATGGASAPAVPARPPRRLVLVAPRRVLVEDQFVRAQKLAASLAAPARANDPIVGEVAAALRRLITSEHGEDGSPLGVAQLRGGVRLDSQWRLDPAQCQVICATPQMWGSRLLGRGFRGSRLSRNLETGLLAHDAVVVIDEAHLHGRLVETASKVARLSAAPMGLQVVAMSATQARPGAHGLTAADTADADLRRRVRATKRVEVVEVDEWSRDAVSMLVEQAQLQRECGRGTVGIFVNTVEMALQTAGRLDGEVELVCGRMRPADIARLRDRRPGLLDSRGDDTVDFLVSTQSLEVGVDLDLSAVVTAIAPAAALAQRAGRLNRSGRRDDAVLTVVAPRDLGATRPESLATAFAPYAGDEIVAGADWLTRLEGDASPERISATPLPNPIAKVPLPPITAVELETAAMTSVELCADIESSFYIEEPRDRADGSIFVGARKYLGLSEVVVRDALRAAPPRAHELATVAFGSRAMHAVLDAAPGSWIVRTERGRRNVVRLIDREDPLTEDVVIGRQPDERAQGCHRDDLVPGDVVIVPDGSPICTSSQVIGVTRGRPVGIADVTRDRPDGLVPDAIIPLERETVEAAVNGDRLVGGRKARAAIAALVEAKGAADVTAALRTHRRLSDLTITWCADSQAAQGLLVVVATGGDGRLPAIGVGGDAVTVDDHGADVEARLGKILDALDLEPAALGVSNDQLATAARCHDEGKRHPRFQQRMGAVPDGPALAKPAPGHVADRGDGWRHEQLSAAVAWVRSGGDTVSMIVTAGHHGHGRPLFHRDPEAVVDGWVDCDPDVVQALHRLFGAFGIYERERARLQQSLGVHRLAYVEALLRCADMQISREGH